MQHPQIDPSSPIPLYHQIAELIRGQIERGELAPGAALLPLRQAAKTWHVNLHTVRHAYAALSRGGLVEAGRGRQGTRVATDAARTRRGRRDALDAFVARCAQEARERFGLSPTGLAAALGEREGFATDRAPPIWVVECSAWQADAHAAEIAAWFHVDARSWPLADAEPPPGTVVSTYFHYNDVRVRWPRRLGEVRFLTIHPDPRLREALAGKRRAIVLERDAATAEAVIADLVGLLGGAIRIEPWIDRNPARALAAARGRAPVLCPPRVWAELDTAARESTRVLELRYLLERTELEAMARDEGWQPAAAGVA
ncbi:MAG: GntR family transcriptional regulator [Planctomycetota bacterium]